MTATLAPILPSQPAAARLLEKLTAAHDPRFKVTGDEIIRRCTKCSEWKPLNDGYNRSANGVFGKACICKACNAKACAEYQTRIGAPTTVPHVRAPMHTCTKCGQSKELTSENFHADAARSSGFKSACKVCVNAHIKEYKRQGSSAPSKTEGSAASQAFTMFADGATPSQVASKLKVSAEYSYTLHRKYKAKAGSPDIHHHEKGTMIRRLLANRKGLRIYETCAYLGETGELGVCNKVYREFGTVVARGPQDKDWVRVTRMAILMGDAYDVVDVDGYGQPADLLMIGIYDLVKDGGFLITTWPPPTFDSRAPSSRMKSILHCRSLDMNPELAIEKYAMLHGRKAEKIELQTFDKTARYVHRITKLAWGNSGKDIEGRHERAAMNAVGVLFPLEEA